MAQGDDLPTLPGQGSAVDRRAAPREGQVFSNQMLAAKPWFQSHTAQLQPLHSKLTFS